ncbi:hypothetical protein I6N90_04360 [Paenibacillus sp. GSMTC-2017]|uniref:hypothetical protein n=1 Tax=Paenibacillus sp. GSMTC-2017 TaxID=2794350 RepID=UPI0018D99733|nr:hypothetical protein [Paenibacillus sp. GSMTC-2017]MBH5317040.1 hypothetical protein [Paenibacillus sp. GSMTC-2017]
MKMNNGKERVTKLLLTATMCAILIFSTAACNNGGANNASNGANNSGTNSPIVTGDPQVPLETEAPEDSTMTP